MKKKLALIMAIVYALSFPVSGYAETQKRELTEFCAMFSSRFKNFAERNYLDVDFRPFASSPYLLDDKVSFSLFNLEMLVDTKTYSMDEIYLTFASSFDSDENDSTKMACLIAMVSALEYDYMEDVYYELGKKYNLAEDPCQKAYDVVKNSILPAYGAIDPDTLVRSSGEMFPLYEGNYSYYARRISFSSGWMVDIVAVPHA